MRRCLFEVREIFAGAASCIFIAGIGLLAMVTKNKKLTNLYLSCVDS